MNQNSDALSERIEAALAIVNSIKSSSKVRTVTTERFIFEQISLNLELALDIAKGATQPDARHAQLRKALYPNGVKHPQQGQWESMIEVVKDGQRHARACEVLRDGVSLCIEENLHLADGDVCTLRRLKDAIAQADAILKGQA